MAAFLDVQLLQPGSVILPEEVDMSDKVAWLAGLRKLERVKTYRQLQACSNMLGSLTDSRWTLSSFHLPAGVVSRPALDNEVRVVRELPDRNQALLVDTGKRVVLEVLPAKVERLPLLVLGLDQGSIGMAGLAFAEDVMELLVHTKWDRYHRVVRDLRQAFLSASKGVFLKAQLYSSYVWSVNFRPFASGMFGEQKRRILSTFLSECDASSPLFCKHGPCIAADMNLPFESEDHNTEVWHQLENLTC